MQSYLTEGGEKMGTALSILLTLFVNFVHGGNGHVTAQAQVVQNDEVTATPTVSPTDQPTDTPTVEPTSTVTPTPDVTVTPSVTPTGTPDGDKDDMFGLKADVHALFGLMNAGNHHEQNEQRFEAKHDTQ